MNVFTYNVMVIKIIAYIKVGSCCRVSLARAEVDDITVSRRADLCRSVQNLYGNCNKNDNKNKKNS